LDPDQQDQKAQIEGHLPYPNGWHDLPNQSQRRLSDSVNPFDHNQNESGWSPIASEYLNKIKNQTADQDY
jgi:hypothetical protein